MDVNTARVVMVAATMAVGAIAPAI
jgi:hypothetical protein